VFRKYRGWMPRRKSRFSKDQKEDFAAKQRANPTYTERLMWEYLRDDQCGATFQRQVVTPCGWIADFLCESRGIIIEVDGSNHREAEDEKRDRAHHKKGYRTLRIDAHEVESESPKTITDRVRILVKDDCRGMVTYRLSDFCPGDHPDLGRLTRSQLIRRCSEMPKPVVVDTEKAESEPIVKPAEQADASAPQHAPSIDNQVNQKAFGDALMHLSFRSPAASAMLREGELRSDGKQWLILFKRRFSFHYNKCISEKFGPVVRQVLDETFGLGRVEIRLEEV